MEIMQRNREREVGNIESHGAMYAYNKTVGALSHCTSVSCYDDEQESD